MRTGKTNPGLTSGRILENGRSKEIKENTALERNCRNTEVGSEMFKTWYIYSDDRHWKTKTANWVPIRPGPSRKKLSSHVC